MKPGDYVKSTAIPGVALRVVDFGQRSHVLRPEGYLIEVDYEDRDVFRVRMVGDDQVFEVEAASCERIDDFCTDCGQLGCGHGRYK